MLTFGEFLALLVPLIHILGAVHALDAVMRVRTSQGAIAWGISLLIFPYAAIPLYWVFGRTRFSEYVETLRESIKKHRHRMLQILGSYDRYRTSVTEPPALSQAFLESISYLPFSRGNKVELLINGTAIFDSILAAIKSSERYVLVQSYIVRDDLIGTAVKEALIERARAGVKVFCMFDSIGGLALSDGYVDELLEAGVQVSFFRAGRKGFFSRFRLNFRNHRKIVVVDGHTAYIGGVNIGDEYLGRSKRFGNWRDTQIKVRGPGVVPLQLGFSADWAWMTGDPMEGLEFAYTEQPEDQKVITIPTGPSDTVESASLMFTHLINSAQKRAWLASPYFVPDAAVMSALVLAVLRGVDVRLLIPGQADHIFVYLAGLASCNEAAGAKVRVFRYKGGFMHQKVALIDSSLALVGTANLDNRSFRLNFETSTIVADADFAKSVEEMLERDFASAAEFDCEKWRTGPVFFRMAAQTARLLSPVL